MHLSWRNYLLFHASREDLESNSQAIQHRFSDNNLAATEKFITLADYKALVVLTCNPLGKEIQATFYHHQLRTGFQQKQPDSLALMGFGQTASAVRVNPDTLFATMKTLKSVPSMKAFLALKDTKEFRSLQPETDAEAKIRNKFAVLPPFLADGLFDLENFEAAQVAMKFITKIKCKHSIKEKEVIELEESEDGNETTTGDKADDPAKVSNDNEKGRKSNEEINKEMDEMMKDHGEQMKLTEVTELYHNILVFLWSAQQGLKSHPGLALPQCIKSSTNKWVDSVHAQCLLKNLPQDHPSLPPPVNLMPVEPNLDGGLTAEFKNLARAISAKHLSDLKEKNDTKSEKSCLRFEKMSSLKQNTMIMFQVGPGHDQCDVDVMQPPPNMLVCLNQKGAGDVAGTLHHQAARNGVMANFESGLAAAIHQGNLASTPRATDINNFTVFFIHPGNKKHAVSARDALLYQIKAEYGKLNNDDVEALISMKPFAPFDFPSYLHMLKGMEFLCTFLGGEYCYSSQAWRMARSHAERNEFLYVDKSQENAMVYASLLNDYHRRHMTFLHSLGDKAVDAMATDQMDFSKVTEKMDCFEYVVNRPAWLPKRDHKDREKVEKEKKRQKPNNFRPRLDSVNNPNHAPECKIPENIKFGALFEKSNRDGIEQVPHPDGSIKCNNWHYRGWCIKTCRFEDSHKKELTDDEKAKGKEYLMKLVEKYKNNAVKKEGEKKNI